MQSLVTAGDTSPVSRQPDEKLGQEDRKQNLRQLDPFMYATIGLVTGKNMCRDECSQFAPCKFCLAGQSGPCASLAV